MDYSGLPDPRCPHCDCNIVIHDNDLWELYEEDDHDVTCPECGKDLVVSSFAVWTFSTSLPEY